MRGTPLTLVALLLLAPLVASLPAPAPPAPALPLDLADGDLLRLIAARQGVPLREPALVVPPDATLEGVTLGLAERAGATLTDAHLAELRALDPRIAAPTLTLLLALEQAWDLRDEAYAGVPPEDEARLRTLDPATDEAARLAAPIDRRALYEAAILLLDTLEGPVLPALRDAARTMPWPDAALVDNPVLRLGGAGDDTIATDRILQIDPRGNDLYRNNAGASTLLDPATFIQTPVAVLLDLGGNDRYDRLATTGGYRPPAQGSGMLGIGVLLDLDGDDSYSADRYSMGAGSNGVGLLRDHAGNDRYDSIARALGWSSGGPGILRDDLGHDFYLAGVDSGGAASYAPIALDDALGLLWDRSGADTYDTLRAENDRYGWVAFAGTGWLADEGDGLDLYQTALNGGSHAHGCNGCDWRAGFTTPPRGRGVDNAGGLARLLAEDAPFVPLETAVFTRIV